MKRVLTALFLSLGTLGAAEAAPFDRGVPFCDAPGVLSRVADRFAYASNGAYGTFVAIEGIERVRESAFRPGYPGLIERRYCRADAFLSDGSRSAVYYLIEAEQGFASIGANVEFCLPGHDRWRVHDAWCRTVRP
ncbi:cytoplasmic protein [Prosthecomicrobium pneumaticum]|uniref:Cytoplasmic protein n=1 Tax=Prosthecomicrobium pneumaticum TaxID=81895 RepID=A0A7W9CTU9_9HYPH|nr:cytoplasmic protein [Prosthecomicrobium pneumaticum]MBB5751458.1 hypothetical protein [Prosthecomicrobium pneumaticum]